jgi:hypothetical protein
MMPRRVGKSRLAGPVRPFGADRAPVDIGHLAEFDTARIPGFLTNAPSFC